MNEIIIYTLALSLHFSVSVDLADQFSQWVKSEIRRKEDTCTYLIIITGGNFENYLGSTSEYHETFFVSDEAALLTEVIPGVSTPYKHYSTCFLILLDPSPGGNLTIFDAWPSQLVTLKSTYIFFFEVTETPSVDLVNATTKLQHAFFVSTVARDSYSIYVKTFLNEAIVLALTFPGNDVLWEEKPNFRGGKVVITVCPICDKGLERFEKTGKWNDFIIGTIYEMATAVNGTLELLAVFGAPRNGQTQDGQWDDYVEPTLDGSAVFVMLLELTEENSKVIYTTKPIFFDKVGFISAPPKLASSHSLAKLAAPLQLYVWIGVLETAVCMFIALETIIQVHCTMEFEDKVDSMKLPKPLAKIQYNLLRDSMRKHSITDTGFALLNAVLEQAAICGDEFKKNFKWGLPRFLIALWYILVIILGSCYKSDLTSAIVSPTYVAPPRTFREVIEFNYSVGALFWSGNLEDNFEMFNQSVARQIIERVDEYDFLEPDCYVKVLEEKFVCIGAIEAMTGLSTDYTTDIWGDRMYVVSQETLFPVTLGYGVSMHYPSLVGPMNKMIAMFQATGIQDYMDKKSDYDGKRTGKIKAREIAGSNPIYKGTASSEHETALNEMIFNLQVMAIGYTLAIIALIIENVRVSVTRYKLNRFIIHAEVVRQSFRVLLG